MTLAVEPGTAVFTNDAYRVMIPSPAGSVGSSDGGVIATNAAKYEIVHAQIGRVVELKRLLPGWNLGKGAAITESAISVAANLVANVIAGAHLTGDIIPLESGGILLEWTHGPRRLQVEVEPDGAAEFSLGLDGELHAEGHLYSNEFGNLRSWLAGATLLGATS